MRQAGRAAHGAGWSVRFPTVAVRLACISGLLLVSLATIPARAVAPAAPATAASVYAGGADSSHKLSLAFEANAGQADASMRFMAHGDGFTLALAPDALTLVVGSRQSAVGSDRLSDAGAQCRGDSLPTADCRPPTIPLRFAFAGANSVPSLAAEQPLAGVANYFLGNDPARWHTNVPTSARVRYTALYPGIDLTVYGAANGEWEYDAIIAPGADPAAFALAISGADTVRVDETTGELTLATPAGEVRQHAPVAYQEHDGARVPVAARYDMRGDGSVGFAVGGYDQTLPLVIDPTVVFAYSTYLGGSNSDYGAAIAVDGSKNVYVTGYTNSMNFPTLNASQPASGGINDAFVTKLNASGALVYSTYLGGSLGDAGNGIAVDTLNNAYVTGDTGGGFPTLNAAQPTFGGATDAFVTKFNASGARVYSTYLGGASYDYGYGIAVDTNSNAYVTGYTYGMNFPLLNASQPTFGGGSIDAFVTKLNMNGALAYSTYLGGSGADGGAGIAVDSSGNAYVTGSTNSTNFPTLNASQPVYGGGLDAFVTKVNASGALVYSTYLGGTNEDYGSGITVDTSGNAYVTGLTISANFPTLNTFQTTYSGGSDRYGGDAFVTKLDTNGARVYSTYLGGSGDDQGRGIAVDGNGTVYVTGNTASTNFPTLNAFQPAFGGGTGDAFVTKLAFTSAPPLALGPTSGSIAGGYPVTFTGTNFGGTTTVTFGSGASAVTVPAIVFSPTSLSVIAPAHAAGTVDVTVTVNGINVTKTGAFTFGTVNTQPTAKATAATISGPFATPAPHPPGPVDLPPTPTPAPQPGRH